MVRPKEQTGLRPKLIALSVAACFSLAPGLGLANPTGPRVVSGSAAFAANGNLLTVTNSAGAIINWQGFSIGINEITRFVQPSALSAVLNRVIGSGGVVPQSLLQGVLSSNGHVYLLNPSGVVIGATARIDVAGLVASSLNLSNEDFLAGRLRFTEIPGAGGVVNHGVIETPSGGRVFLIAPEVQNTGIIRSPQGEIVLAAGREVEMISEANPYITVRLTADTEQALNVGSLISASGRIGMYGALVRHAGVAEASGAALDAGGNIRFVATKDLTLEAGSRVAANGSSGGSVLLQAEGGTNLIAGAVEAAGGSGKGGIVQALGVRVGVIGAGVIDASGDTGGGTVLVGGDFQGKNPDIQNAQRTYIGPDGVIRADARTAGDGGRVIVWADGDTRFYGSISARGGSQSGNGGFVETSGKHVLDFRGLVDTRAPKGRAGTLLLDPDEITITHAYGGSTTGILCNGGACPGTGTDPFTDTALAGAGILSDGTINTQLGMGSVVVLTSVGGIVVDGSGVVIAPTGGSNSNTLTLDSATDVSWDGDWSYTNNGVLTLLANNGTIFNNAGKLTAGSVILSALNGIGCGQCDGTQFLQTQVTNLQATNTNKSIEIQNTGDLTLKDLGAGYAISNAYGGVRIITSAGNDQPGNLTVSNLVMAGTRIELRAAGDLLINANLTANTTFAGNASALVADVNNDGSGSITQSAGTVITTNHSNLDIGIENIFFDGDDTVGSGQNIMLGGTVNAGSGQITIRNESGSISTNATGLITADSLAMRSQQGIDVDTSVNRITARNGGNDPEKPAGTGDIIIRNSSGYGGPLTLEKFFFERGNVAVQNRSGNISVSNDGSINIADSVNSGTARTTLSAGNQISSYYGGTIFAGDLVLSAVNGIGCGNCDGDSPLQTQVTNLQATNTNMSIEIQNTGDLTLKDLGAGYAISNAYGGVRIITSAGNDQPGNLTVSNSVTAGRRILLNADGDLALNADLTANTTGRNTSSELIAYGSITGSGNIFTNGSRLVLRGRSVMTGGIDTTGGSGGEAQVEITSTNGAINTGRIQTGGTDGGEGFVRISASGGGVTTGDISTGSGDNTYIRLSASGMVTTGNLATRTSTDGCEGGCGYSYVLISAGSGISTGSIATGDADYQTFVGLRTVAGNIGVSGAITTGSATTPFGANPYETWVHLNAPSGGVTVAGDITTGQSFGGSSSYNEVRIRAGAGDIGTGAITTRSFHPANPGGDVRLTSSTGSIVVGGTIDTRGADGIPDDSSSYGGSLGGLVSLSAATGAQVSGSIFTSGGNSFASPGGFLVASGARGGDVCIGLDGCEGGQVVGSINVAGAIVTTGGSGSPSNLADGGSGGYGGSVSLFATDSVTVGAAPTFDVFATVIDTSGGAGGTGFLTGGQGGNAGNVFIDPVTITLNGVIIAMGGAGGAGSPGGAGGIGGLLSLLTTDGTGTINFFNGGWDVSGGLGGAGGGSAGGDGSLSFVVDSSRLPRFVPTADITFSTSAGLLIFHVVPPPPPPLVEEPPPPLVEEPPPLLVEEPPPPVDLLTNSTDRSVSFLFGSPEPAEGEREEDREARARMAICRPRS